MHVRLLRLLLLLLLLFLSARTRFLSLLQFSSMNTAATSIMIAHVQSAVLFTFGLWFAGAEHSPNPLPRSLLLTLPLPLSTPMSVVGMLMDCHVVHVSRRQPSLRQYHSRVPVVFHSLHLKGGTERAGLGLGPRLQWGALDVTTSQPSSSPSTSCSPLYHTLYRR